MAVESLLPGGSAHTCNKIDVGDELVEVNGKEVITMSLGGVRHMIMCGRFQCRLLCAVGVGFGPEATVRKGTHVLQDDASFGKCYRIHWLLANI